MSERTTASRVIVLAFVSGSLLITGIVFTVSTLFPQVGKLVFDSQVRDAWAACRTQPLQERTACYTKLAVQHGNPHICWLTGAAEDDGCMQNVFEQTGDPAICNLIDKEGVQAMCEKHFEQLSK